MLIEVLGCLLAGAADLRALSTSLPPSPGAALRAGPSPQRMDRVLNWIESHLADELSVDEAAAVAHVSANSSGGATGWLRATFAQAVWTRLEAT